MSHSPRRIGRVGRLCAGLLALAAVVGGASVAGAAAPAAPVPSLTGLSTHRAVYWGGDILTVSGTNLTGVSSVLFGKTRTTQMHVVNPTTLTVRVPWLDYGTLPIRVTGPNGTSKATKAAMLTLVRPTLTTPVNNGMTARQMQAVGAKVINAHKNVAAAPQADHWTTGMGLTAVKRAASWIGMPYSWAGGNGSGPTYGVCAHNGGDVDCHVRGFDCSGLTLYAWAPYRSMAHYTVTQRSSAGRFHPTVAQLVPGDLVFFSGVGHVGIYAGNGDVIEAPMSGWTVTRSKLADMIRWDGYSGAVRPMATGRQGSVPVIDALGTTLPLSGGLLTIRGQHLAGTVTVTVGSTAVTSFVSRSDTAVTLRVPAHAAGAVAVTLSTAWGTSQKRAINYVPAPTITSLTPATGSTQGGDVVVLSGTQFPTLTSVTVDGVSAPFGVMSGNQVAVTMPAHAAGTATVVAVSPYGSSAARTFTYVAPATSPTDPTPTPTPTSTSTPAAAPTGIAAPR